MNMKNTYRTLPAVIALLMLCTGIVIADATREQTFVLADKYGTADALPVDLFGYPIVTAKTLTIKLPATYDAGTAPLAVLWLKVDNVKAQKVAAISINGHPLETPIEVVGTTFGLSGQIRLNPTFLKPGANDLRVVFADNLNGATGGWTLLDVFIAIARRTAPVTKDNLPLGALYPYLKVPDVGTLAVYDSSLGPMTLKTSYGSVSGWRKNWVWKAEGDGKSVLTKCEQQSLSSASGGQTTPFGLAQMDNGELILLVSMTSFDGDRMVSTVSKDRGNTWSDWSVIPGGYGRPVMLAYLGGGNLAFGRDTRFLSSDYGRTWDERVLVPPAADSVIWGVEGNPLVDRDASGMTSRIAEIGYIYAPEEKLPFACDGYIRWSTDSGRTWADVQKPDAWHWKTTEGGVSDASLVRAKNGWLVAALRTEIQPDFYASSQKPWKFYQDTIEGTGISISKDDGKTWSPVNILFEAGECCTNLLAMPNGDILMTLVVRNDIRDTKDPEYRRGCEAMISKDNGLTWNTDSRTTLFKGDCGHASSIVLDDGRVLTAYANYLTNRIDMIRWSPDVK
jgi:hypothetical protein